VIADVPVAGIAAGDYPSGLEVSFDGDLYNLPASGQGSLRIDSAPTTLTIQAPTGGVFGEPLTMSATLAANVPHPAEGIVTFVVDGSSVGSFDLAVQPVFTGTTALGNLAVGSHTIEAVYAGTSNIIGSRSSIATVVVSKASAAVNLTAAPSPSGYQEPVLLRAAIGPLAPGSGVPTGTVTFMVDGAAIGTGSLALVNGESVATLTTSNLSVGIRSISADYSGDGNFNTVSGAAASHTVNTRAESTTTEVFVPASALVDSPVGLEAVVTTASGNSALAGTVEFSEGEIVLGATPVTLSVGKWRAMLTRRFPTLGVRQIRARFVPSGTLSSSTSLPAMISIYDEAQGAPAVTTTSLSVARRASAGEPVTATVTVKSKRTVPPGAVEFHVDGVRAGTAALVNGNASFTFTGLSIGVHQIVAVYAGAPGFTGSTSAVDVTVSK
jgi:hypothetical protein